MMRVYLAVTPDQLRSASRYTRSIAHMAYHISQDGRLIKDGQLRTPSGILVLSDHNCGPIQAPAMLCRDVWMECAGRGCGSVLADFELPLSEDRSSFLQKLAQILARNGRRLFVPEHYGEDVSHASVLICTALSGGCLSQRLEEAKQHFGPRLALDLQRLRMSFPLPCPSGEGSPMTASDLQKLMETQQPAVFFSPDLCAKYFTYICGDAIRFVLFDDAETLRKKIHMGRELGIHTGFMLYPETEDLLPQLFQ